MGENDVKLLQVNSVCGYGSTGRIAADLARAAEKDGFLCKIAYGRGTAPDDCDTIRIGSEIGVRLHGVLSRISDKHGFYSTQATRAFLKEADAFSPDLIHLHNIHGYYVNIELLFEWLQSQNKPVVWTLHDCWAFTGHCAHFDRIGCEKWKTGCHTCPQKGEYPASMVFDRSAWNYAQKKRLFTSLENLTIVTPSAWLGSLASQSFFKDTPVRVIENGIDLSVFHPVHDAPLSLPKGKKIVLGVASVWTKQKGFDDLIALSELLDDSFSVVIVGVTQAQKDALPERVIGITRTNNAHELAALYTAAHAFVNPTYEDTFPTTNLEALACGTPVITYRTGGSPESIDDTCGIVVEQGNVKALADAVQSAAFSTEACVSRGKLYDKNERFLKYLSLYHELLA